jgi:hypothetical protein
MLRRWVEERYQLPLTHEAFQDVTPFELLVWFWEDHFENNPIEAKKVGDGNEVQFVTDDPLINKWEAEIAKGLTPDLMEGLTPEQRQKEKEALERLKTRKTQIKKTEQAGEGFSDDYTDVATLDVAGLPVLGRGR